MSASVASLYETYPWWQPTYAAAYAADSVVHLLDPDLGFASPDVRRLFSTRAPFALFGLAPTFARSGDSSDTESQEDARLLAALLGKISHRGQPTPCSVDVERAALRRAGAAGVLQFSEDTASGAFRFTVRPRIPGLTSMLKACLLPELVLDDADTDALLVRYYSLCTHPERRVLRWFAERLADRRLALLIRPQRSMGTMLHNTSSPSVDAADLVDFAVELPYSDRGAWLRMIIEVDDATHAGAQVAKDNERDKALASEGWITHRFRLDDTERGRTAQRLRHLVESLQEAVPPYLVEAAQQLRALPTQQRLAIEGLVLLPLAEGQITAALAQRLAKGHSIDIGIADPQGLGIEAAVQAAAATVRALTRLDGVQAVFRSSMR